MKINIESYLHQIDSSFKDKSQKDIYMTYIMIFAAIFAFAYLLFWDAAEKSFEETNKKIEDIQAKIQNDKMYLVANPESKITLLMAEIKKKEDEMLIARDNNAYIKSKIETISSLIYDERTWGEYLHSISSNAKKHNINLTNLTNQYALNNKSFGHILDISVSGDGNFADTLRFINSLEKSDLVVDLHDLNISAQDKLKTSIKISVWGITY